MRKHTLFSPLSLFLSFFPHHVFCIFSSLRRAGIWREGGREGGVRGEEEGGKDGEMEGRRQVRMEGSRDGGREGKKRKKNGR